MNLMKKDKISNSQMLSFIWVEGVNNPNSGNLIIKRHLPTYMPMNLKIFMR